MKCTCKKCKVMLKLNFEQVKNLERVVFTCPSCQATLSLGYSVAKCYHCNSRMKYYKHRYDDKNRVAKCPSCEGYNKLPL